jgi:TPR repeat protein
MTQLPLARIYAIYQDGMQPDALHWRQLQTLAQEQTVNGDADALHTLALLCFYNRYGLERDTNKAEKLFIQAAKLGSTGAMWELGRSYAHSDRLHKPWLKDLEKARHYLQMGADLGFWRCKDDL